MFWLAAVDKRIYEKFRIMGIEWNKIGKEKYYLGSDSVPAELFVPDAMMKLQKNNHEVWNLISNDSDIIILK